MNYKIPKTIRTKPKLLGLEMKELVILLISSFLILNVLQDLVHRVFIIPYFIISIAFILWLIMPSRSNPGFKNYKSLYLYFKRNKETYYAMDVNKVINPLIYQELGEERNE